MNSNSVPPSLCAEVGTRFSPDIFAHAHCCCYVSSVSRSHVASASLSSRCVLVLPSSWRAHAFARPSTVSEIGSSFSRGLFSD